MMHWCGAQKQTAWPSSSCACLLLPPAGLQTSVQDWPGRVRLWHVGVPPSGPMDSLHHRLANALVGNPADAAALEFGLTGPTVRFHCDCTVALTGDTALMPPTA
jgi:allophanate hydrolase subunit 2